MATNGVISADDRVASKLVTVIVLHWARPDLTRKCLSSLQGLEPLDAPWRVEVRVVDNGSGDAPAPRGDERLPWGIQSLERNYGYAGGNNRGLRAALDAGSDAVLLLNNDAIVEPSSLRLLLQTLAARPGAGAIGPAILRLDGRTVESLGHAFDGRTGRHKELLRDAPVAALPRGPRSVDGVSGCAFLMARAALQHVGLFDERFYLYFEDLDWCLRSRSAGFSVWADGRARVRHTGGGTIGKMSPAATFYGLRNHLWVADRHGSRTAIQRRIRPWLILGYHLAYLAWTPRGRTLPHVRAVLHAMRMRNQAGS
ncbi:MAG: glycosyltransferase family 2 protein [Chloroflexi bacterium]|nr:glycosyltransferase family 2 protein [Chloroflexota bacterium]